MAKKTNQTGPQGSENGSGDRPAPGNVNDTTAKKDESKNGGDPENVTDENETGNESGSENENQVESKAKILVCIPYLKDGAQGKELVLAIAGWKKHFKEDFSIVVIGDHESFLDDDEQIIYIPHTCVANGNPPLDIAAKMMLVMETFPEFDGMVWANDDMYAVNDFDLTEVKLLKSIGELAGDIKSGNHFQRNMAKTANVLKEHGLPTLNFSAHCPVWYDFESLIELIEMYELDKESYLISSLYFNSFFPTRIPLKLHITYDNIKCGIYRPNPNMDIVKAAFKEKIWINNSVEGYIPAVLDMIEKHYQE